MMKPGGRRRKVRSDTSTIADAPQNIAEERREAFDWCDRRDSECVPAPIASGGMGMLLLPTPPDQRPASVGFVI